jgi:hypothetical protein
MSFTLRGEINGDVLQNGVRTAERSDFSTMEIVPPYGTFRPFGKGIVPHMGQSAAPRGIVPYMGQSGFPTCPA